MCDDLTPELVHLALAGDVDAYRLLIERLAPEIQLNVYKMLYRWRKGSAAARDLRQEIEDISQEVFLELIKSDGKVLRRWDPDRLNLCAYVSYIARIRTAGVLRSRLSPWREEPRPEQELDRNTSAADPEADTAAKHLLDRILECLYARFRPDDLRLFELLFLAEEPAVENVAEETQKTVGAVYKWRSRLYQWAKTCREKLSK